jgi:oxygen-independent coproporphyrinogen-3 oxidase
MLRAVARTLPLAADVEWTVEANPETVTAEVACVLAECGVNRVSMGAQSFHPHLLKALERWHDPANVARAVDLVRAAGIRRVNMDLIFGIPQSTLEEWQHDVALALALRPSHVSCYGLTYEPNTALTRKLAKGDVQRCPEDVEAAMYEAARVQLAVAGMRHYEISNWALPDEECRHNLLYWRNRDWMALGPSASGHARGVRWKNVPRLGDWLASGPWSPAEDVERVDDDARVGERLMMGLRLREGVAAQELQELLAMGARGAERAQAIADARGEGLLEDADGALRLTARGQLLADSVLCRLI